MISAETTRFRFICIKWKSFTNSLNCTDALEIVRPNKEKLMKMQPTFK